MNLRVNEYYIGVGPPELATIVRIYIHDLDQFDNVTDDQYQEYIDRLSRMLTNDFGGMESVLFIAPAIHTTVESWTITELWDVQHTSTGLLAVSPFLDHFEPTAENLELLVVPLTEVKAKIVAAAEIRDRGLPFLVTDANLLRPFYQDIGISYKTDPPAQPPPSP